MESWVDQWWWGLNKTNALSDAFWLVTLRISIQYEFLDVFVNCKIGYLTKTNHVWSLYKYFENQLNVFLETLRFVINFTAQKEFFREKNYTAKWNH